MLKKYVFFGKDKKINRLQFAETIQEFNYIVDEIKNLVDSEACPTKDKNEKDLSQIAIIAK